jgi:hypothetical protein
MTFIRPVNGFHVSGKIPHWLFALGTLLIIFLASLTPLQGYAEEKGVREYPVPEHGSLQLNVPQSWNDEFRESTEDRLPTIIFRPDSNNDFEMIITLLWNLGEEKKFDTEEKIRSLVEADWKAFSKKAKETKLSLHKLSGRVSRGFYYTATDKAPKKGEYKYLMRAGVGVGDLLLSVTMLSHKKESQAIKDGLHLLEEAKHKSE